MLRVTLLLLAVVAASAVDCSITCDNGGVNDGVRVTHDTTTGHTQHRCYTVDSTAEVKVCQCDCCDGSVNDCTVTANYFAADTDCVGHFDTAAYVHTTLQAGTGTACPYAANTANLCSCDNGIAATCTTNGVAACASCDSGFYLSGTDCLPHTSCTLSSQTLTDASATAPGTCLPACKDPADHPVTCSFTMDNSIWKVYYNNVDITSSVTSPFRGTDEHLFLYAWYHEKQITFTPVAGAALAISGYEWDQADGLTATGDVGFMMTCEQDGDKNILYSTRNHFGWRSFSSNSNPGGNCCSNQACESPMNNGIAATPVGPGDTGCTYPSDSSFPANWYSASGPSGTDPTVGTSVIPTRSEVTSWSGNAQQIWDGKNRYGAFRVETPASVSCVL
jgi:hypothetical protein